MYFALIFKKLLIDIDFLLHCPASFEQYKILSIKYIYFFCNTAYHSVKFCNFICNISQRPTPSPQ